MPKQTATISPVTANPAIAKSPTWTTLPQQPISYIYADHRINTDIDVNGVGRVQIKPGYNANIAEVRYDY